MTFPASVSPKTYAMTKVEFEQLRVKMTEIDPLGAKMQKSKQNGGITVAFALTLSLLCYGFLATHLKSLSRDSRRSTPVSQYTTAIQTHDGDLPALGSLPVPRSQKSLLDFSPPSSFLTEFEQTGITHSARKMSSTRTLSSSKSTPDSCSQYDFKMN